MTEMLGEQALRVLDTMPGTEPDLVEIQPIMSVTNLDWETLPGKLSSDSCMWPFFFFFFQKRLLVALFFFLFSSSAEKFGSSQVSLSLES